MAGLQGKKALFLLLAVALLAAASKVAAYEEEHQYDESYEYSDDADEPYEYSDNANEVDSLDTEDYDLPRRVLPDSAAMVACGALVQEKEIYSVQTCLFKCGSKGRDLKPVAAYHAIKSCLAEDNPSGKKKGKGKKEKKESWKHKPRPSAKRAPTIGLRQKQNADEAFDADYLPRGRVLHTHAAKGACSLLHRQNKVSSVQSCLNECGDKAREGDGATIALKAIKVCLLRDVQKEAAQRRPGKNADEAFDAEYLPPGRVLHTAAARAACELLRQQNKVSGVQSCLHECGHKAREGDHATIALKAIKVCLLRDVQKEASHRRPGKNADEAFDAEYLPPGRVLHTEAARRACQVLHQEKKVKSVQSCLDECGAKAGDDDDARAAYRAIDACLMKDILGGITGGSSKPKKTKTGQKGKVGKKQKWKSAKRPRGQRGQGGALGGHRRPSQRADEAYDADGLPQGRVLHTHAAKGACSLLHRQNKVSSVQSCLNECGDKAREGDGATIALKAIKVCLLRDVQKEASQRR